MTRKLLKAHDAAAGFLLFFLVFFAVDVDEGVGADDGVDIGYDSAFLSFEDGTGEPNGVPSSP